jgi:hypothetical protein
VQLPDGQDRSAQINGARVVPLLSAALCLTSVGPPPVVLFSLPPFPCCRVSSIHLSSVVLVALLSPTIHSFPATCPTPFPHPFLTQRRVRSPVFSPSTWMSSAMVHPLSPSLSSPSLLATPSTRPPIPSHLPFTMSSALALMSVSQDIQLFQVAAREVIRIPKC